MREIPLTQGKVALVDDEDYERVMQFKWSAAFFQEADTWYAHRGEAGHTVRMHRFILDAKWGEEVDHRNSDGLDNRRANLRRCTRAQNSRNTRKRVGTSRFKGVTPNGRGRWKAQITFNGTLFQLGRFDNEVDAARAYNEAALRFFGEFARLNQIDGTISPSPEMASKPTTCPAPLSITDRETSGTSETHSRLREHLAALELRLRRSPRGNFARRTWLESQKKRLEG